LPSTEVQRKDADFLPQEVFRRTKALKRRRAGRLPMTRDPKRLLAAIRLCRAGMGWIRLKSFLLK